MGVQCGGRVESPRLIAELDDDAETFGAISADTWFKHRNKIRHEIAHTARLYEAVQKFEKMLSHYVYSRENRETLAFARKVLSEYQPPVEPAPDE